MGWPTPDDYDEAAQNLHHSMGDEELRAGQAALDEQQLPMVWAGNFAHVYKIHCPATGNTWALKCFTKEIRGQGDRYPRIAEALRRARLPFTVPFEYLKRGVMVRGKWLPALKMQWIEGQTLNRFVESSLDKTGMLRQLLDWWPKLAARVREAGIAHADLQHGNVLLVPMPKGQLAIKLIDYDGMYVPALAGTRSGELGHAAYQHPQRVRERTYSADVDRFSHLVIYTAVRCLKSRGWPRDLWRQFNNDDNLLFREADFRAPGASTLFQSLWNLGDQQARAMVGRLVLACGQRLEEVPWLDNLVVKGRVQPLTRKEERQVAEMLAVGKATAALPATVGRAASSAQPPPLPLERPEPATTTTETRPTTAEGTMPAARLLGRRFRTVGESLWGGLAAVSRSLVTVIESQVLRAVDALFRPMVFEENDILRYALWAVFALLLSYALWAVFKMAVPSAPPAAEAQAPAESELPRPAAAEAPPPAVHEEPGREHLGPPAAGSASPANITPSAPPPPANDSSAGSVKQIAGQLKVQLSDLRRRWAEPYMAELNIVVPTASLSKHFGHDYFANCVVREHTREGNLRTITIDEVFKKKSHPIVNDTVKIELRFEFYRKRELLPGQTPVKIAETGWYSIDPVEKRKEYTIQFQSAKEAGEKP
jgi:serine/threonine protein kinase